MRAFNAARGKDTQVVTQQARLSRNGLAYTVNGVGEPIVFIHGALSEAFLPLNAQPAIAGNYRQISYDRRGYGATPAPAESRSIEEQAADCSGLLAELGVDRAHVVGHSYGGCIALQLAVDDPERVGSLTLLEPALPEVLFAIPAIGEAMGQVFGAFYAGDATGAIDWFMAGFCGPNYREALASALPAGAFERAVAPATTIFTADMPALQNWNFGPDCAARVNAPVLSVIGENSQPVMPLIDERLRALLPRTESYVLPGAAHLLMVENPADLAARLTTFLTSHPLG